MATTSKNPARSGKSAISKSQKAEGKVVVSARHANCVALNFSIPSKVLEPSLPAGLVLDHHKGDTFVSLVCMEIQKLTFCGLPIVPRFCELSLRCFVSERENHRRKGVLYLKSYSSSKFGSWVLNNVIPHQHGPLPIRSKSQTGNGAPELDYHWKVEGHENRMRIRGRDRLIKKLDPGSKLGFFLSHDSRYITHQGTTIGYDLSTPDWVYWDAAQANFTCDVRRLFGAQYVKPLAARPVDVVLSEGSLVKLHLPRSI